MRITRHDTDGTKPNLLKGELGYDDYNAGGDVGRVYVGKGDGNIALAKKSEVDDHKNNTNNPHSVTKTQVGLGNVTNDTQLKINSNLSDLNNVATARTNLGLSTGATSTVTISATDTEAGRLLKVGDFGVGASILLTTPVDFDSLLQTGVYSINSHSLWNNSLNRPSQINNRQCTIIVNNYNNANIQEVCQQVFLETGQAFFRNASWQGVFTPWQEIYHTGSNTLAPTTGALTVGTNDASNLTLRTNNAARVTVTSDGNVGIGTTTPHNEEHHNTLTMAGVNGGALRLTNNPGTTAYEMKAVSGTLFLGSVTNHPISIRTNNTERMRITSTGNLLIGTTTELNSVDKLQVNGSISANNIITFVQNVVAVNGNTETTLIDLGQAQFRNTTVFFSIADSGTHIGSSGCVYVNWNGGAYVIGTPTIFYTGTNLSQVSISGTNLNFLHNSSSRNILIKAAKL